MKLSGNTVLVTGGSTGIGFELSKHLVARGNTVIITGRDPAKLG
ncbi:MAG TPA: SDR family NAD(P)-dependent oxidoreductase, partial [Hyphomicrobium sp.]